MLPLLAIDEAQIIREPGFAQWVVYALVAIMVVDRLRGWFLPSKREISGRVVSEQASEPADAQEMDEEIKAIKVSIEALKQHFDSKLDNVKREITNAGQTRADTITTKIDNEVRALRENTDQRVREMHEKINAAMIQTAAHTAQIDDLRTRDHAHEVQIMQLMKCPSKPR